MSNGGSNIHKAPGMVAAVGYRAQDTWQDGWSYYYLYYYYYYSVIIIIITVIIIIITIVVVVVDVVDVVIIANAVIRYPRELSTSEVFPD